MWQVLVECCLVNSEGSGLKDRYDREEDMTGVKPNAKWPNYLSS